MRYGFEAKLLLNTGTAAEPVWSLIDAAADVDVNEESDEIAVPVRSLGGVKPSARGVMSKGFAFAVEGEEEPTGVLAALIAAARTRSGIADLLAADSDAGPGDTATRLLSKLAYNDKQPLGDRWLHEFSAKPARSTGQWKTAGVAPLSFVTLTANDLLTEDDEELLTEAAVALITEG